MKKTLLPLALILTVSCFAQTKGTTATAGTSKPVAQFGIKAGANLADVKTDLYPNHEAKWGFHAGLLAHIHLNSHLAIQPEIIYSRQGFKQQIASNSQLDMKLDYINIPVLIQYMNRGFRLETGPQIGLLVKGVGDVSTGQEYEMKDFLKSTDFSWSFGLGYLSVLGVGVSARYNLGINNINESVRVQGVQNNEMNNRVWQFGLFYQFVR